MFMYQKLSFTIHILLLCSRLSSLYKKKPLHQYILEKVMSYLVFNLVLSSLHIRELSESWKKLSIKRLFNGNIEIILIHTYILKSNCLCVHAWTCTLFKCPQHPNCTLFPCSSQLPSTLNNSCWKHQKGVKLVFLRHQNSIQFISE